MARGAFILDKIYARNMNNFRSRGGVLRGGLHTNFVDTS